LLLPAAPARAAPPKSPPKYLLERGSVERLQACDTLVKKNCWSTENTASRRMERWVPPGRLQGKPVIQELKEVLAAYPQQGQAGVDQGGWKLAEEQQANGVTYLRYEFTSGRFHYVDELEIRIDETDRVSTRSASREGGFDYGVNAARLNFIQDALAQRGWQVRKI
jgi:uncharacterized protein (DUF1499 family)